LVWDEGAFICKFLTIKNLCCLCRLLKGRSFPGKVLLSRKTDDTVNSGSAEPTSISGRSDSENDLGTNQNNEATAKVFTFVPRSPYFLFTVFGILFVKRFY
jgi:hypothetical protein